MKKFLLRIFVIYFCLNAFFLSSCKEAVENEVVKKTDTEEIKLNPSTKIVDFSLIGKLKKGMKYEEVTKILNNTGRETNYGEVYVYRLEEDRGLFISFDSADEGLCNFKIEPFIDPAIFDDYIVKQIERNGSVEIGLDMLGGQTFGSTGVHIGGGYGLHEYYLSDGRVIHIQYVPSCGGLAEEAEVVDTWFKP